jgi:hypothetical protein
MASDLRQEVLVALGVGLWFSLPVAARRNDAVIDLDTSLRPEGDGTCGQLSANRGSSVECPSQPDRVGCVGRSIHALNCPTVGLSRILIAVVTAAVLGLGLTALFSGWRHNANQFRDHRGDRHSESFRPLRNNGSRCQGRDWGSSCPSVLRARVPGCLRRKRRAARSKGRHGLGASAHRGFKGRFG